MPFNYFNISIIILELYRLITVVVKTLLIIMMACEPLVLVLVSGEKFSQKHWSTSRERREEEQ